MRRLLIDECINPRLALRLRPILSDWHVETVRDLGWSGLKDHHLVLQIQGDFDVFVTIDSGFEFEQNLKKLSFGIIVIETTNNQMPSYERVLEQLFQMIPQIAPGQVMHAKDPDC